MTLKLKNMSFIKAFEGPLYTILINDIDVNKIAVSNKFQFVKQNF